MLQTIILVFAPTWDLTYPTIQESSVFPRQWLKTNHGIVRRNAGQSIIFIHSNIKLRFKKTAKILSKHFKITIKN